MLTVNELFSGIGSQRAALERLGIEHKVVGIAEIDRFATLSYAAIYNGLNNKTKDYDFPSGIEMVDYLKEKNIGFDFKQNKPFSWERMVNKRTGKANKTLKQHYLASALSNNYGDISKVDKLDYADFWTYSFPCQDISIAGKQEGISKHTRSGLLYEVERLLEVARQHNELPKYLMLENVKNLVGKKFKPQFEEWIQRLDELGFNTYWQVLNAKNYGVPQNRERVFGISIRKDIDTGYVFPEPLELKTRLKDVLEKEVDEKFYLSEEYTKRFAKSIKSDKFPFGNEYKVVGTTKAETERMGTNSRHWVYDTNDCMSTLDSTMYKQPKQILEPSINQVGMLDIKGNEQIRRVYGDNGLSPTLNSMQGGNRQPKILETDTIIKEFDIPKEILNDNERQRRVYNTRGISPTVLARTDSSKILEPILFGGMQKNQAVKTDGISTCLTSSMGTGGGYVPMVTEPIIAASRGRNPNNPSDRTSGSPTEQRLEINQNGTSNTITTVQKDNYLLEPYDDLETEEESWARENEIRKNGGDVQGYRIRKLTPKECWRLMGFTDEQFQKAQDAGVSNSQLYKQAGNSIVVDVLYYLFKNLFTDRSKYKTQISNEEQLLGQMSIADYIQEVQGEQKN